MMSRDNEVNPKSAGRATALSAPLERDLNTKRDHDKITTIGSSDEISLKIGDHSSDSISKYGLQDPEAQRPVKDGAAQHSVFTLAQRRYIVFMAALAGFFSPLSANIYFPVLNILAADFNVTPAKINLTITTYMIFQGIAPTIFGDLADIAGRRPAYLIGFTIYIGACIGIACCQSYAGLLVLRCLQSSGSSGTIALASGVVADISTSSERGVWMGFAMSGPMIAPAISPVLGGVLGQTLGWRSIFWFLVISASVFLLAFAVTFPETGRNIVSNGSIKPKGWNMSLLNHLQARRATKSEKSIMVTQQVEPHEARKWRIPNPLKSLRLFMEKDLALLLFFSGILCCASYDIMASLPHLLEEIYGFDALKIGLCFLPFGAGCFAAPYLSGKLMDWNFRRVARSIGFEVQKGRAENLHDFPLERCRLTIVLPMVLFGASCVVCYGWTLQVEAPLAAPLVLIFFVGMMITGSFNVMSAMLVDLHPQAPATAQAANNLARCLMGSAATAVIAYMLDAMGRGWCFTFIGGVVAAMTPILWILERNGPRWRKERRLKIEREALEKQKSDAVLHKAEGLIKTLEKK